MIWKIDDYRLSYFYQSVGKKEARKNDGKYQNIVIGFGKGGKTLAKALASKGESVLVVEKSTRMYGGTCINIGCIPSKSLIFNGERGIDFTEAVARKEKLTGMLRAKIII